VAEPSKGKRRRGTQRERKTDGSHDADTTPVGGATIADRLPRLPWLVGGLLVLVVLGGGFLLLRPGAGGGGDGGGGIAGGSGGPPGASASESQAPCPTSQPSALAAGETRTVTITTPKGQMILNIESDLSPIAAGNFVTLVSCGFYDETPFHRTPTLPDGTPFVIQGGDPTGTGSGGPGYTIKDEPVTTAYKRGTVAMARTQAPNSVGSQFFIVLDDKDGPILGKPSGANTYQIIGNVTSGMDTADAIFAASGGIELPSNPILITTATVANP
jgi:cyclophilin family peptidyl-prolyl cis-trans isomerase